MSVFHIKRLITPLVWGLCFLLGVAAGLQLTSPSDKAEARHRRYIFCCGYNTGVKDAGREDLTLTPGVMKEFMKDDK